MHKKLALLIKEMIDGSPYNRKLFQCDIHEKETSGFWILTILVKETNNAHSESLYKSLDYIGIIYGESLNIEKKIAINGKGAVISVS